MQPGIAEPTIPFLGWGTELLRLRQRRLERPLHRQRPRLPAGRSEQLGHHLRRSGRCCSTTSTGKKFELVPAVEGTGLALVIPAPRRGLRRPLQRRPASTSSSTTWTACPSLLRNVNRRPPSLGRAEPDRRTQRVRGTPSAPPSISPPAACGSAATCSAAAALFPPTTRAFTSAWAMRIKWTQSKFTGRAA